MAESIIRGLPIDVKKYLFNISSHRRAILGARGLAHLGGGRHQAITGQGLNLHIITKPTQEQHLFELFVVA